MKIQNRSSVLSTGIWKISDMSQVQETQNVPPASQTESIAKLPTDAQRNQQRNEFKSQEQLLRANLQQQLSINETRNEKLSGVNLNKQMSAEFPDNPEANTARAEILRLRMDGLKRSIRSVSSAPMPLGSGTVERDRIRQNLVSSYENELENLRIQYQKLRESQEIFEGEVRDIETGRFPKTHSEFGNTIPGSPNGEGSPFGAERNSSTDTDQRPVTSLGLSHNNPYHRGWRRPSSNGAPNNSQNSASERPNEKGGGQNEVDYSAGTNSSNESHSSGADNRDYTPEKPKQKETDANSGGGYENDTHDQNNDIDIVSPPGYAPGEYQTLSAKDPMTGHGGKSGNDIGASGRIPKGSPDNRSGIQQIVQPGINLFSTTTGADDKERPDTGNTQVTVWNPSEGDDLGDDLPYDLSRGGGSIDLEAGKILLEQIRPINPGGPDPTKMK